LVSEVPYKQRELVMKRTALALLLILGMVPVWAADDDDAQAEQQADNPERGVARLSVVQGNVSIRRGDAGEMIAGAMNGPLIASDQIMTGEGSRAEVQFDGSNLLRIAPGSEIRFGDLQYHRYQIQIAVGTVTFRVLRDNDAQIELSTPNVSVRPLHRGVYRIVVRQDGTSQVTVRAGDAEIFSPKGSETLRTGQTMEARGNASDPEFQIVGGIANDAWDQWNAERDRDMERSVSGRYVSPDVYGTEQLDQYGHWVNDGQYGNVWVPTVAAGWSPYSVGRWVWLDYYGWTWVSDDPWGWAPYHYGRWYYGSYGWCWWPGAFGPRYYWRPALVGFFGWGSGFGFGFGFGHVGWVPLAPFERFHPWYGRGIYAAGYRGFGGRATIVNNTNITNVYRNARVAGGVTGVASNNFGRGAVNAGNTVRPTSTDLGRAGMVRGQMGFTPSRESMRMSDRPVSTAGMPRSGATNFVSRNPSSGATGGVGTRGNGGVTSGGNGNWTRFNPSQGGAQSGATRPSAGSNIRPSTGAGAGAQGGNSGNWHRFDPGSTGNAGSPRGSVQGGSPSPSYNRGSSGSYSPQPRNYGQGGSQQPMRVNPPMVRERGGSSPSGGSYQPRYNPPPQQQRSAPAPSYSAPRSSAPSGGGGGSRPSGGGGGGSRPSGGGGGGSRSSGGGGGGSHGRGH
jgi:hypothetical protein